MDKMRNQDIIVAEKISDNEIIARVLKGEKNMYALIVRRYNQRLYRVAMSIVNDESEAEDIIQTAYIKAYENLAKFEYRSGFPTWLTKILINESLLRLKKRKKSLTMNDAMIHRENSAQRTTDSITPLSRLLNGELKLLLENAIRQLPEKYRTVFIMREIENMNVAETQECLALTEANVKVRLNRARALLRNSLSMHYKKEDILSFHLSRCNRVTENVMRQIELYDSGREYKT